MTARSELTTRITRRVSAGGVVLLSVVVVGAAMALLATSTVLFAAHTALDLAPELPAPEIDVAEIDDLTAAIGRTSSSASVVVDAQGQVIGRFKPEETYRPLAVGAVPPRLESVLLAAEDVDFREHGGFDPTAIARAIVDNVATGDIEQGGSTITQQLAKNLFTGADQSLERKLVELQIAIDLEENFTKDEIITAYVNSVFLGNGLFGFEAAARSYFDKPAAELTVSETALLVGVLPAPSARDPRSHPDAAEAARRRVLDRVEDTGSIPAAIVDAARDERPEVLPPKPVVEEWPYYMDYVRRYLLDVEGIDPADLFGGGLTIETALVREQQDAARAAVEAHLPPDGGPQAALAVVDVRTGLVTALVGGTDFSSSQVNLALGELGGGSGRQAGSSFKPFVLAAAFEQGYVPSQRIDAPAEYLPTTVDDPEPVRNFGDNGFGKISLVDATLSSVNTAFVSLTEVVGADAVRATATALGVGGLPESVGPSIGIGAYETSPLAMAGAYAGFADDGRRVDPSPVRRVLDRDGTVVVDLTPAPSDARPQPLETQTARQINAILAANVEQGTATRAQIGRPAAAKTGTSDDFTNAWLVGHTPHYAAAVWVGDPAGNVPLLDVGGFDRVTGGSIPALIWQEVMAFAHRGLEVEPFPAPAPEADAPELLPGITTTTTTPELARPSETTTSTSTTTRPTTSTAPPTTAPSTTTPSTTTTTRPPTTTTTTAPPATTTTVPPSGDGGSTTTSPG